MWKVSVTSLLVLLLAPACAPDNPAITGTNRPQPLVLLTDTSQWEQTTLDTYRDSLQKTGYRVVISGFTDETSEQLLARLPWLLQPGVSLFIYDHRLAGAATEDSLRRHLQVLGRSVPVVALPKHVAMAEEIRE